MRLCGLVGRVAVVVAIVLFAGVSNIASAQSFRVTGTVVAPGDSPVPGALVRLRQQMSNHEFAGIMDAMARGETARAVASQRTAADGSYALEVPEMGLWFLEFSAEGYATLSQTLALTDGDRELSPVKLVPAHQLDLKFADEQGRPVAGALVRVSVQPTRTEPGFGQPVSVAARSNASGVATLWVAEGRAQVDIAAPGFVPGANRNIPWDRLSGGDWNEVTLLEAPQQTIKVTVDGEPVRNAALFIEGGRIATARTNSEGKALVAVPPMATKENPMPMLVEAKVGSDELHHHFGLLYRKPAEANDPAVVTTVSIRRKPVEGTVVDRAGKPVVGALVRTLSPLTQPTTTDQAGRYRLVLSDQYPNQTHASSVQVSGRGIEQTQVPVGEHQHIRVSAPRALRITAVDVQGQPVPGVEITVVDSQADHNRWRPAVTLRAVTDAEGNAQLDPLEIEKAYLLKAYRPGYRHFEELVAARNAALPPVEEKELLLEPGSLHAGWVTDTSDQAIAGAVVEVRPIAGGTNLARRSVSGQQKPLQVAFADSDGRFEVRDLEPQKVSLAVSARGFASSTIAGVELGEVDSDLGTIALEPGLLLEGRVIDQLERGVGELTLKLSSNGSFLGRGAEPWQTVTLKDGAFSFEDLPAGAYAIWLESQDYITEGTAVQLPADEPLVIEVEQTLSLEVRVLDEAGDLAPRPNVFPENFIRGRANWILQGGVGLVYGLQAGATTLNIVDGSIGSASVKIELDEGGRVLAVAGPASLDGETLVVTLEPGIGLEGRVMDAEGMPIERASVYAAGHSARVANGRYRLLGLEPGEFSLNARSSGYAVYEETVVIEPGRIATFDIVLERGLSVSGFVRGEGGQPVAGAHVSVQPSSQTSMGGYDEVLTDQSGAFRFESVGRGPVTLAASAEGFARTVSEVIEVNGPLEGIELTLGLGARIYGAVTGLPDDKLLGLHVSSFTSGLPLVAEVGYDGTYEMNSVPEGMLQLVLVQENSASQPQMKTVNVPRSGDLEVNFSFGTLRLTGQVLVNGQPKARAGVMVMSSQSMPLGAVQTDADGRFVVEGLEEGEHQLMITNGRGALHQETLNLLGDQDLLIEIDAIELVGRVVDASGNGIEGAHVTAMPAQSLGFDLLPLGASGKSGSGGEFRLQMPSAADGTFTVHATAQGYAPGATEWSPGRSAAVQVVVTQGADVQVQWIGRKPDFAQLSLVDERSGAAVQGGFGSRGSWRIENARLGRWLLHATWGLVTTSQRVEVVAMPEGEVNVVQLSLPETGTLRFASTEAGEVGGSGLLVNMRLLGANGEPTRWAQGGAILRDWTPVMMRAEPVEVAVGNWTVELRRGETLISSQAIFVGAGQTVEVMVE